MTSNVPTDVSEGVYVATTALTPTPTHALAPCSALVLTSVVAHESTPPSPNYSPPGMNFEQFINQGIPGDPAGNVIDGALDTSTTPDLPTHVTTLAPTQASAPYPALVPTPVAAHENTPPSPSYSPPGMNF